MNTTTSTGGSMASIAIAMAPPMCRRLLQVPRLERFDFRSLGSLRKAGSPFSMAMASEIIERITPNIYQGYASTETGSVTLLRPHEQISKIGSSGRLEWGVETRLATPEGEEVSPGEEGEITVRGPNVCVGYYRNPGEEAKAFRDGWFRTGDIGRFDEEGYLWVVGRIKDMIKTGGENVASREVEEMIYRLPQVSEVAVIGLPDPKWVEAVTAVVVVKAGQTLDEASVIAHCQQHMANFKTPKRVVFADTLPKNPSGKLLKRELHFDELRAGLKPEQKVEAIRTFTEAGQRVAGIYPWEVAETKLDSLLTLARKAGHPLQATIEDA